ncbi:60S ribosome subunit biogenesis protein NIP7 like [Verticillium longisporum]|uniref:60S ribosome subunit biogenesis protein NIP7 n=5 Tax=Verticillium TaxID=1036719 RepID=G2X7M8_VERDV|nr:ribosome biogenesis protein NIP7 [Verticillium alfalfae VaMs.102]XP_009657159.1 60S ribosome subunit biogenesis protein NIP7 [Verticillium dahliae VdLs.17]XP_028495663.1 ribosome biosynthesis protein nip7 [Verticillium nonalfalfae]KAF3347610.1 Peroxisomal primary amine oxidase [Verticillium dahliae VDG2]KAF3356630.1 hypothetical protein VdG1_06253 [Verticillium dahliae VDG1]KAG7123612.1 60S ribosome subunit biogenesis protein NIP7 like [Verticillium longisporum]KAH6694546.1 60S ribosome su
MRPLVEEETKKVFAKLANYTGGSLKQLIQPLDNGDRYVLRLQKDRVYYVLLSIANLAVSIERAKLLSIGTCLGKFTKKGSFKLHITALPILAEHARYKLWVKPNGEMPLLYGSHCVKAHVGRWTDDIPEHAGIVFYNMADVPIAFGVTARSTADAKRLDPTGIVAFRQADCGEYVRDEDTLFSSG